MPRRSRSLHENFCRAWHANLNKLCHRRRVLNIEATHSRPGLIYLTEEALQGTPLANPPRENPGPLGQSGKQLFQGPSLLHGHDTIKRTVKLPHKLRQAVTSGLKAQVQP